MIGFSFVEYLRFCVSALIYGGLFSFIECSVGCILSLLKTFLSGLYSAFVYNGEVLSFKFKKADGMVEEKGKNELLTCLKTILFSFGLIVLSFFVMDGEIRLFAVAISLLSYIPFSKYLSPCLHILVTTVFSKIFEILVIVIRIVTYLPRRIILLVLHLFGIICKYFTQNNISCKLISIDNTKEKC